MEHSGNQDRWNEIRARRQDPREAAVEQLAAAVEQVFLKPDPLEAFAAAVSARRPRKRASGTNFLSRALAIQGEYIRESETRWAERERRNGAKARAAFDRYERTRARVAPEREFEPELSPLVAMTMHLSPGPLHRIY